MRLHMTVFTTGASTCVYIQSTNNPSTSLGALCMPCHLGDPVYVFTISPDPGLNQESHWLFENVMFFKSYF